MPTGPPEALEAIVRFWIPPACREEVLGDLCEQYTGPGQYIALAMCVVPCVIFSRIRRTTGIPILLTEALLIYGSFLAATWYADKTLLTGEWGFLRVAIPTVFNLVVLILDRAWDFEKKWLQPVVLGINFYFFNPSGYLSSVLMVLAVEILFRPGANLPQGATGPALRMEHRAEPAGISKSVMKTLLPAAAAITLAGIIATGYAPGIMYAVTFLAFVGWGLWSKRRKE
jgi:hypothetical protein